MEETKIWSIGDDSTSATQLNATNQMETEGLLEDILTANPDMLEDGLQLVGRQTSTAGGPLDLLGVDTDGRLVVYELKRGKTEPRRSGASHRLRFFTRMLWMKKLYTDIFPSSQATWTYRKSTTLVSGIATTGLMKVAKRLCHRAWFWLGWALMILLSAWCST